MNSIRFLRLKAVSAKTGFGRSWIYAHEAANSFPQHFRPSGRTAVWLESEIEEWMAQRVEAARAKSVVKGRPVPKTRLAMVPALMEERAPGGCVVDDLIQPQPASEPPPKEAKDRQGAS